MSVLLFASLNLSFSNDWADISLGNFCNVATTLSISKQETNFKSLLIFPSHCIHYIHSVLSISFLSILFTSCLLHVNYICSYLCSKVVHLDHIIFPSTITTSKTQSFFEVWSTAARFEWTNYYHFCFFVGGYYMVVFQAVPGI